MTFVVDASVAFKWLVDEPDSPAAMRFAEVFGDDLHAPDLLHVEVLGAIIARTNEKRVARADALRKIDWWSAGWAEGVIRSHRVTSGLARGAAELAVALGHPLKDCVYLMLADQLGCPLATADAKFAQKVGDPERVKLLADLV